MAPSSPPPPSPKGNSTSIEDLWVTFQGTCRLESEDEAGYSDSDTQTPREAKATAEDEAPPRSPSSSSAALVRCASGQSCTNSTSSHSTDPNPNGFAVGAGAASDDTPAPDHDARRRGPRDETPMADLLVVPAAAPMTPVSSSAPPRCVESPGRLGARLRGDCQSQGRPRLSPADLEESQTLAGRLRRSMLPSVLPAIPAIRPRAAAPESPQRPMPQPLLRPTAMAKADDGVRRAAPTDGFAASSSPEASPRDDPVGRSAPANATPKTPPAASRQHRRYNGRPRARAALASSAAVAGEAPRY